MTPPCLEKEPSSLDCIDLTVHCSTHPCQLLGCYDAMGQLFLARFLQSSTRIECHIVLEILLAWVGAHQRSFRTDPSCKNRGCLAFVFGQRLRCLWKWPSRQTFLTLPRVCTLVDPQCKQRRCSSVWCCSLTLWWSLTEILQLCSPAAYAMFG